MSKCKHQTTRKSKCCGSTEYKEFPWCEKLNAPLTKQMCSECQQSGWIDKAGNIANGYIEMGLDAIAPAPKKEKRKAKRAFVQQRLDACRQCQHRTYLKIQQYNQWIRGHGGYAKFILQMDRLDQWLDLPDNKDPANGKLFCRRCKCFLEAKANVKKETCPVGHPDWQIDHQET